MTTTGVRLPGAFESEDDVPEVGYTIISEDEAFAKLAKDRPGISYDF